MRWLVAGLLGAAVVGGMLGLALESEPRSRPSIPDQDAYRGSEPPGRHGLPRFSLRNFDGRRVNSTELRGRIIVLTFLDSQCTDTCPILASQIGQTIGDLTPAERDEVIALAISADPAEDTPMSVRTFLAKQRARKAALPERPRGGDALALEPVPDPRSLAPISVSLERNVRRVRKKLPF